MTTASGVIILLFVSAYTVPTNTGADKISGFQLIDTSKKNTCVGDLDCFITPPVDVILVFKLAVEKEIKQGKYKVVIEGVLNEQLTLCKGAKGLSLAKTCSNAVVPAGSYTVSAKIHIPEYKDLKTIEVSGPNKADVFRGLMSYKSSTPPQAALRNSSKDSHPPSTICMGGEKYGAC